MFKKKSTRYIAVGIAALVVATASTSFALAANATVQANGSDGKVYLANPGNDVVFAAGHTFAFTDNTEGVNNTTPSTASTPYACPADATNAQTFLAPAGQERTKANWVAWANVGFASGTNIQQPALSLYKQTQGAATSVKGSGGSYSIGVACTSNSNASLATAGVWFASIHIVAGGSYTVDQPTEDAAPPVGQSSEQINATTVAAQDGTLSLIVPAASATVTLGTATVAATGGLSTSTGSLGAFTVHDARFVTHAGWTLSCALTDFTSGTNTISKSQLGLVPTIVSGTTPAAGVTLGGTQIAGKAIYQSTFAQADNSAGVADTNLGGNLIFVAPAAAPVGTYTATMTLTLTSK